MSIIQIPSRFIYSVEDNNVVLNNRITSLNVEENRYSIENKNDINITNNYYFARKQDSHSYSDYDKLYLNNIYKDIKTIKTTTQGYADSKINSSVTYNVGIGTNRTRTSILYITKLKISKPYIKGNYRLVLNERIYNDYLYNQGSGFGLIENKENLSINTTNASNNLTFKKYNSVEQFLNEWYTKETKIPNPPFAPYYQYNIKTQTHNVCGIIEEEDNNVTLIMLFEVMEKDANNYVYNAKNSVNINIYMDLLSNEKVSTIYGNGNIAYKVNSNEYIEYNSKNFENQANSIISEFKNGKQTISFTCCVHNMYDENGNKVIDIKNDNKILKVGDVICPFKPTPNGDVPYLVKQDGSNGTFKIISHKLVFDGAIWQEIVAQEITTA